MQLLARHGLSTLLALCALSLTACGGAGAGDLPTSDSPTPPSSGAPAGTATLQWSSPNDPRVQGYRVYYGTSSKAYLQIKGSGADAGQATSFVVSNLQSGKTYYFAVTAYDASQNESDYSREVAKLVQ